MRRFLSYLIPLGLIVSAFFLLSQPQLTVQAVGQGLTVCSQSILPSLFPFFVVSDLWVKLGYAETLGNLAAPFVRKVFHLPGELSAAFVLGCLGGYPIGAKTVCELYQSKKLSRYQAEAALRFCNNAGPAFFLGILGGSLLGHVSLGFLLWIIHLCSAILIGFLFRPRALPDAAPPALNDRQSDFLSAFTQAVTQGSQSVLQVCSFVIFFCMITYHLEHYLPESIISNLFMCTLELSGGVHRLAQMPYSQEIKFVLGAAMAGWGGVCVHCQSIAAMTKAGLSCKQYLIGKLLQCAVSLTIACILAPFVCQDIACFTYFAPWTAEPAISVLLAWCILLGLKTSSGKGRIHDV